jgi:hypothetical protein
MQACGTTGARAGEREEEDGEENWGRGVGKSGGDERVFIAGRASGWQMQAGADAMPQQAGGQGDHGAAKPDGVLHKYSVSLSYCHECQELGTSLQS